MSADALAAKELRCCPAIFPPLNGRGKFSLEVGPPWDGVVGQKGPPERGLGLGAFKTLLW